MADQPKAVLMNGETMQRSLTRMAHEIIERDEPLSDAGRPYAKDADWMLHEAFCLFSQADIFDPYEKHHSTVKDACELAQELGVRNLLLYHTEDRNIARRKELYAAEGQPYFGGTLWVPDDLESIEL